MTEVSVETCFFKLKNVVVFSAECTIGMGRGLTPLKHYRAMANGTMAIRCKL